SAAYNIAFTGRVRSPLRPDALRAAFQGLVDRHAMLRSVFPTESGQPVRRPAKSRRVAFNIVDASNWPDDVIHERLRLDIDRPFDLANGPVLRVHLYTRSGADAFLAVVVHHIAVDGWSLWSCLSELAEL